MDQRTSDLRARLHPAKLPTCEEEFLSSKIWCRCDIKRRPCSSVRLCWALAYWGLTEYNAKLEIDAKSKRNVFFQHVGVALHMERENNHVQPIHFSFIKFSRQQPLGTIWLVWNTFVDFGYWSSLSILKQLEADTFKVILRTGERKCYCKYPWPCPMTH